MMIDTKYNDFCKYYKKKLKNDKDIEENIKENEYYFLNDFKERINFNLNVYITSPSMIQIGQYNGQNLFRLDKDDLKYLYDKYSKKAKIEMKQNIIEIKKEYKK